MKTYVKIFYGICLGLVLIMLALFKKFESADEFILRDENECSILTDYEVTSYENESAPIGLTQEYKWILTDVPKRGGSVTFYVIHQEIDIFIDNELIYSLAASDDNRFTKTVGCDWAKAYLYPEDEGKEIRILVHPIYETSIGNDLTIYYGNYDVICNQVVQSNLPILIIGLATIVIGILFILFIFINRRNKELDTSVAYLGAFSIFTGLWKLTDMTAAPLIFKNPIILSAIAITSIAMMPIPYIIFMRQQIARTNHRFWNMLSTFCSIGSASLFLLQLFGVADLRQTLTACHIIVIISILAIVLTLIRETRYAKLSPRLKVTVICCALCMIGTLIDMVVYYISGNSGGMMFCLLSFLIYVILMGYMSLRDALQLIEQGREAKRYEHLAMHDELTGLFSRIYFAEYQKRHNMEQNDCFIVMFDVNNLKKCNDTRGHDCGDQLLKNSANMIKSAFLPEGRCIRMGGDEFCVFLRHINEKECQTFLKKFDALIAQFNSTHPDDFPVEVAYGYAYYDKEEDFDFGDTRRRADKMMYEMKIAMKTIKN